MTSHALILLTDLGDSAVLGAITLLGGLLLLLQGCRREALAVLLAFCFASGFIFLLKLICIGCAATLALGPLRSPSGHAALSVAVLGSYALLLARPLKGATRALVVGGLLGLALAIAASRLLLGAHTLPEVLLGTFTGALAAMLALALTARMPPAPRVPARALALLCLALMLALNGNRLPAERLIHQWAAKLTPYCG